MRRKSFIVILILISLNILLFGKNSKEQYQPDETIVFKTVANEELKFYVFYPPNDVADKSSLKRPVFLMFHGGGWQGGKPSAFFRFCSDYAKKGFVTISCSYRIRSKTAPKHTPFDAIKDAKSAVRYLKLNSLKFGIDTNKIILGGSSAGAHTAIATSLFKDIFNEDDDLKVDTKVAAVILMCPVIDTTPETGYKIVARRLKEQAKAFSPIHNLEKDMPPQLILLGDKDTILSEAHAKTYVEKVQALGCDAELIMFKNAKHGWFYHGKFYRAAMPEIITFIEKLNLMP